MDPKPFYASKTIWLNVITVLLAIGAALGFAGEPTPEQIDAVATGAAAAGEAVDSGLSETTIGAIAAGIVAAVNFALRWVTKTPIAAS